ncbi:hypothetical protein IQ255_00300 [Pleurocapsales cyanobacterium LEGE 10410]|nr:hypothetical protein [Pleurocapsales cyanobacterium LEGE 10410]
MNERLGSTNEILNSCIKIESIKISRQLAIPHQVYFCLNSDILDQIEIEQSHHKLTLSSDKLADLRYYILLNIPLNKTTSSLSYQRSPITFSTNYLFSNKQQPTTVVRSVINLESGKITQQIQQDLWQNRQLLSKIISAHYWLIYQIIEQLPLESSKIDSRLICACSLAVAVTTFATLWYFFPLNYLATVVIALGVFFGWIIWNKSWFNKQLKSWIIHHLIDGCLAKNVRRRKIALRILSFMIH